jgi:hypothetical protein
MSCWLCGASLAFMILGISGLRWSPLVYPSSPCSHQYVFYVGELWKPRTITITTPLLPRRPPFSVANSPRTAPPTSHGPTKALWERKWGEVLTDESCRAGPHFGFCVEGWNKEVWVGEDNEMWVPPDYMIAKNTANLHRILFVWLVAGCWCWFVMREKYCRLVAGAWFVLREKYQTTFITILTRWYPARCCRIFLVKFENKNTKVKIWKQTH